MRIFRRMAAVRMARARAESTRTQWHTATDGVVARARLHPVAILGAAAGVGLIVGRCNLRPWRIPGLGALLGGGLAEGVALAVRLVDGFGVTGHAAAGAAAEDRHDGDKRGG